MVKKTGMQLGILHLKLSIIFKYSVSFKTVFIYNTTHSHISSKAGIMPVPKH